MRLRHHIMKSHRAQHEIDFKYEEAMCTADNIMTFKLAVKTIGKKTWIVCKLYAKTKAWGKWFRNAYKYVS